MPSGGQIVDGTDLDLFPCRSESGSDCSDVVCGADARGKEDVDRVVLDGKLNVESVLVRERGQVDTRPREVDALLGREHAGVGCSDEDMVALDGEHLQRQSAVVKVDDLARRGRVYQIGLGEHIKASDIVYHAAVGRG